MKIIERLSSYIDFKGISLNSFDKSIGTANGYIGKQIKNKASIGADIVEKIISVYKDLSVEWLITGTGEMLKSEVADDKNEIPETLQSVRKKHQDICREKDEKILSLQNELIEIQRKLIECLENPQQPDKEVGQKRKAG